MVAQTFAVSHILKNILFRVQQNKSISTGLKQLERVIVGWTIPLNILTIYFWIWIHLAIYEILIQKEKKNNDILITPT